MKIAKLTVKLLGVEPEVKRTLEVRDNLTLGSFHYCLQLAMGWHNCHMHSFYGGGCVWGDGSRLSTFFAKADGGDLIYEYDHGDCWEHSITIDGFKEPVAGELYPRLTGAVNRCPPEDCGGAEGYRDLLEEIADPTHPEHKYSLDWLKTMAGDKFDPRVVDVDGLKRDVEDFARRLAGKLK